MNDTHLTTWEGVPIGACPIAQPMFGYCDQCGTEAVVLTVNTELAGLHEYCRCTQGYNEKIVWLPVVGLDQDYYPMRVVRPFPETKKGHGAAF